MLIVTNCTFNAFDVSFFKSGDQFHGFCLIKFGFLNTFTFILD